MIFNKVPIFINTGFCCSRQDGVSYTNYFCIVSLDLSVIDSICKTSCDEVCHKLSPGGGRSSCSLVGVPVVRLHDASSTFTLLLLLRQEACPRCSLFHLYEYFCILFEIRLCVEFTISCILTFSSQSFQIMHSRFLRGFCLSCLVSPSSSSVFSC